MKLTVYGRVILLCALAQLLFGCNPERHLSKKADMLHDRFEQKAAEKCAGWYPAVGSTTTTTVTKIGKPDTVKVPGETQYITIDCDSAVAAAKNGGKPAVIRVPFAVHDKEIINRVDTIRIHDTTVTIDRASETAYRLKSDKLGKDLAASQTKSDIWFWLFVVCASIIVIRIVLKLVFHI